MRSIAPLFLALTVLITLIASAQQSGQSPHPQTEPQPVPERNIAPPADDQPEFVTGEVLVRWRDGGEPAELPEGVLELIETSTSTKITRLRVEPGTEIDVAQRLSRDPNVAWAQPDYLRRLARTVNDPRFDEQWFLGRIHVPEAWDLTLGAPFVIVAVVDSGVDLEHPDLKDRLVEGYNFLDPSAPPQDDAGHGTHAAGIIAATADNGIGVAGVAPNVMIMPLKVLGSNGVGRDSVVARAMNYAVDNGAWVINMSFNGREASPALSDAVAYATDHGVALVVAAGNEARSEPSYPGAIKPAVAVAATTLNDTRPFFTNYGPWVDIAAPGQSIVSTYWDSANGSIYRFETGTSAAAPLVAGVIALMFSVQPTLTVDQIVYVLTSTADPLDAMGIGAGRVNALAAVRAVAPPELLTPTVPPATPTETVVPTPTSTPTNTPFTAPLLTPAPSQTPLILPLITTTPIIVAPSPSASNTPRTATATPGIIRFTPGRF